MSWPGAPLGYTQGRNLLITSALTAIPRSGHRPKSQKEIYPPTKIITDHTVRRGDPLVSRKKAKTFTLGQLPEAGACLSGLLVPDAPDMIAEFWKEFVFGGFCRNDVTVMLDSTGNTMAKDYLVAVRHGRITVPNTGTESIPARALVEVYFIPKNEFPKYQYLDDGRTRFTADHRVLGLRQYDMTIRDAGKFFKKYPELNRLFTGLFGRDQKDEDICAFLNKLATEMQYALRTTVGVAQSTAAHTERFDITLHPPCVVKLDLEKPEQPVEELESESEVAEGLDAEEDSDDDTSSLEMINDGDSEDEKERKGERNANKIAKEAMKQTLNEGGGSGTDNKSYSGTNKGLVYEEYMEATFPNSWAKKSANEKFAEKTAFSKASKEDFNGDYEELLELIRNQTLQMRINSFGNPGVVRGLERVMGENLYKSYVRAFDEKLKNAVGEIEQINPIDEFTTIGNGVDLS
jgi:hypothetical protein